MADITSIFNFIEETWIFDGSQHFLNNDVGI